MTPALDRSTLLDDFNAGFRPRPKRLVGIEYELLGVHEDTGAAVPFSGTERSVVRVLERLRDRHGWRAVLTDPLLELERDGSRVTLEPGAQIELSARPHERLVDARQELLSFIGELREVSRDLGVRWLPYGIQPQTHPDVLTIIPKKRYEIMTRYLPTRGAHALWMMRTTAGMQINLDVFSPQEAARKLRLALLLCPLITALFANSPISEGAPNGFHSRRGWIWRDVDPDRCGIPRRSILPGATTADYLDWALDAGMLFIERDGELADMTGRSFREFMERGGDGTTATRADWNLHLTTLFPEARLKTYLEIRCADSNRSEMAMAYAALCTGLFYGDEATLATAERAVGGWSHEQLSAFHDRCTREGLAAATPDGDPAIGLVSELLQLAASSLARFSAEDRALLGPAEALVSAKRSPADDVAEGWRGVWKESLPAFTHAAGLDEEPPGGIR